jgi:hypothetical protein
MGSNFVIYSKINNRGRREAELLFAINFDSLKNQNIIFRMKTERIVATNTARSTVCFSAAAESLT